MRIRRFRRPRRKRRLTAQEKLVNNASLLQKISRDVQSAKAEAKKVARELKQKGLLEALRPDRELVRQDAKGFTYVQDYPRTPDTYVEDFDKALDRLGFKMYEHTGKSKKKHGNAVINVFISKQRGLWVFRISVVYHIRSDRELPTWRRLFRDLGKDGLLKVLQKL